MGWTLNSLRAELGTERLQQAIDDQREWLPKAHAQVVQGFAEYWAHDPRQSLRWLRMATSFAGFKCYKDTYILAAFSLGKLPELK